MKLPGIKRALRREYRDQGWVHPDELPQYYASLGEEKLYRMYNSLNMEYRRGCPKLNKNMVARLIAHLEQELSGRSLRRIASRFHAEVQWGPHARRDHCDPSGM